MGRRDHFRLLQKKQYAHRVFANPYFAAPKKRPWLRTTGRVGLALAAVGLVLFLANFLLAAKYYQITQVTVLGNEAIPTAQLQPVIDEFLARRVLFFGRQRNRLFFQTEKFKAELNRQFVFAALQVEVQDHTLIVRIEEKASQLIWRSGEAAYLVDLQGVVIRPLSAEENNWLTIPQTAADDSDNSLERLPVFRDLNLSAVQVGQVVLTPTEITNIFLFHKLLLEQPIEFTETRIDRLAGKWMSVAAREGYDILFDPSGDITQQASNLAVVRRDLIKDRKNLRYIDLRFGDHVYFK